MKRIFTLSILAALISVFSMSLSAQRTYPSSYYKGTLVVDLSSMGMAKSTLDEQYVSVTPTSPGYCTVAMYDFNFSGQNLGDIVIENATLTDGQDGGLNISGSAEGLSLADGTITADVTCQGTLDVHGNLDLTIQVSYGDVTIPVTFTGAYTDNAGIADVAADDASETAYYTLNGMLMPSGALTPGCYIKCQGNSATKVLIK